MQLTQKIDCVCRVTATYEEDGRLAIKVFGQAEYAKGRTTTADVVEIPESLQAKAKTVLEEILIAAAPVLGARLGKAVHKSAEVAGAHGEI
jgi:hypothetical protein